MPITAAEYATAEAGRLQVSHKRETLNKLAEDVQTYLDGGLMSDELQETLRPYLSTRLQARLDSLKTSIDADVAAVKAVITDYTP